MLYFMLYFMLYIVLCGFLLCFTWNILLSFIKFLFSFINGNNLLLVWFLATFAYIK